ncbi:MAG: acyl-CoA thioesterase [Bacteroidetes bacterium]|nr:acyl-CoA thioesterase [Bacteroidota bacterium]
MEKIILSERTEFTVRFSEVDSIGIVWHGHYLKYFEDGREGFGRKYGLDYLDVYKTGFITPLVNIGCDFKKPLRYGEKAIVETRYVDCEAAKIILDYTIFRSSNNELVATGQTTQVFLNGKGELYLNFPPFYEDWKKKWGLL